MSPKLMSICALPIAPIVVPATTQVHGKSMVVEERLIARCIHQSARGKWWLEKALFGIRNQEGGWIGAEVPNWDGSHDLGPMQVNSRWVSRFARLVGWSPRSVRQRLRRDACFNIKAARWLLLQELFRTHKFWSAIGSYHSPDQDRSRRYLLAVSRKIIHANGVVKNRSTHDMNIAFNMEGIERAVLTDVERRNYQAITWRGAQRAAPLTATGIDEAS